MPERGQALWSTLWNRWGRARGRTTRPPQPPLPPNLALWDPGTTLRTTVATSTWENPWSSTIHRTYYHYLPINKSTDVMVGTQERAT